MTKEEIKEGKELLKNKKVLKSLQGLANMIDGKEITGISFEFIHSGESQKVDWDKNTKDNIKKIAKQL